MSDFVLVSTGKGSVYHELDESGDSPLCGVNVGSHTYGVWDGESVTKSERTYSYVKAERESAEEHYRKCDRCVARQDDPRNREDVVQSIREKLGSGETGPSLKKSELHKLEALLGGEP